MAHKTVLKFTNIKKQFGGLLALSDVHLDVNAGEIVGLIGPNGAGKSTLFNVATSFCRPDRGDVFLNEVKITRLPPHRISRLGVARTYQLVKTFMNMSALDNVLVGAIFGGGMTGAKAYHEALTALELVGLGARGQMLTCQLTLSERRLLEIARALASRSCVTLLDEPLAGLNPTETNHMLVIIDKARSERNTAILWVEHKVSAIFSLCDTIAVLNYGRLIACGKPYEISRNSAVIEAYLGKKAD